MKDQKYTSICADCNSRVPNGELCQCHKDELLEVFVADGLIEVKKKKADGFIGEEGGVI